MAGHLENDTKFAPKFSICMANFNMANFIEPSILSIYNQLNDDFEIVVVDGGSTDGSVDILKKLEVRLDRLRLIELPRDKKRKLGTDRNISIENAKGDYVLLHLDCDDLYYPSILDWVKVFLWIEAAYGPDILVSGEQINMGRRSFLLKHGPYKNLHFEDRELWTRLDRLDALIRLRHAQVRTRMKIPQPAKTLKIMKRTFIRILEDLQQPETSFLNYCFRQIIDIKSVGFKNSFFRFAMCFIVLPRYLFNGKVVQREFIASKEAGKQISTFSLSELLKEKNTDVSELCLTEAGRKIFFGSN
ncbi:glycosyl transferase [SAR116 cluster alpha proteobacterium HIMB100]|nr:glycosyl transferase [SAR116 cluster alpha proteobacterium HIMB100]